MQLNTSNSDCKVASGALEEGETYYISVDCYSNFTGTFTVRANDEISYDYPEGAFEITLDANGQWSSANQQFSNADATAFSFSDPSGMDNTVGKNWRDGVNHNVWFKYIATQSEMLEFEVKTGGDFGTITYLEVALWKENFEEINSTKYYIASNSDCKVASGALEEGETYYISVDCYSNFTGTFTVRANDEISYDYPEGAFEITLDANGQWASQNQQFSNADATAFSFSDPSGMDNTVGKNWRDGVNHNVWFKYIATQSEMLEFEVKTGGDFGTITYLEVALWKENFEEINSTKYYIASV